MKKPKNRKLKLASKNSTKTLKLLHSYVRDSSFLLAEAFPEQRKVLVSTAGKIAALTTRRAGKTYTAGLALVRSCIENPGSTCLFVASSRGHAKSILWLDIIRKISIKYKLGVKINLNTYEIKFPNESVIQLFGADETPDSRILGKKFSAGISVIIDEAAHLKIDVRAFINVILEPCCIDNGAQILMISTPSMVTLDNYFFDVMQNNNGAGDDWERHKWTAFDNPHVDKQFSAFIARKIAENPLWVQTPEYKINYNCEWVVDHSLRVYNLKDDKRNYLDALPEGHKFLPCVGIDLGYTDSTAIVVGQYSETCPYFIISHVEKMREKTLTEVAHRLLKLDKEQGPFLHYIIDGANKQGVEDLRKRFQIPFVAAKKKDKFQNIDLFNNDLVGGKIKILPAAEELVEEMQLLILDERYLPRRVEHSACENHACDGALYLYTYALSFLYQDPDEHLNTKNDKDDEPDWLKEADSAEEEAREADSAAWGFFRLFR